jgi:hypothetical protein
VERETAMAMEVKYRFVDNGSAPEFFTSGLHDVEIMGSVARFVFYVLKPGNDGQTLAEPPFTFIVPTDAIGPGVALTIKRCSGLLLPVIAQAGRCLMN